ncbi:casein kinase I-like [Ochotona princeps]|uniref:casein kinase I-like n=1 Tax=Ochotona princeps TaxID=9978 RepID=UPI0027149656|nr:casein kinase I-like [Ochotona princeps]
MDLGLGTSTSSRTQHLVGGKYKLLNKIGSGAFGEVCLAVNVISGEEVAVKMESKNIKNSRLLVESAMYEELGGGIGIPHIQWFGQEAGQSIIVLDLLGPSLEDLFEFCSRSFSLKTVLMLADQMIGILEYVHSQNVIHRDIKPENFLMGLERHCNKVYLIDFGLAKKYQDSHTREHIPCQKTEYIVGTARFASINTHRGIEQSRRDDLESLGYVFTYFNRGSLPWQGLKAATKRKKFEKVGQQKLSIPLEELCGGFPEEFTTYLQICRKLGFEETPNYMYFRQIFQNAFRNLNFQYDNVFDWAILSQKSSTKHNHSSTTTAKPSRKDNKKGF